MIATRQSVLGLTAGKLSLADSSGNNILWASSNAKNKYSNLVVLQDTGNLQLVALGVNSTSWESFQQPTDTLLPGQFRASGTSLLSRHSDTDFSAGRFGLYVQADPNVVLYFMELPGNKQHGLVRCVLGDQHQQPGRHPGRQHHGLPRRRRAWAPLLPDQERHGARPDASHAELHRTSTRRSTRTASSASTSDQKPPVVREGAAPCGPSRACSRVTAAAANTREFINEVQCTGQIQQEPVRKKRSNGDGPANFLSHH